MTIFSATYHHPLWPWPKKKTGALGAHATPVAPQRPLLAHRVGLAEGA